MKKLTLAAFFALAAATLVAAPPKNWKYDFPPREAQQEFFDAFRKQVIGEAPAPCDPKLTLDSEEKKDGYTFYRVSYNVEPDERVKAYLLVPDHRPGEKLPLVFCLHPTFRIGKDVMIGNHGRPAQNADEQRRWDNRANALELVKRGFVCFAPDRLGYGERTPLVGEKDPVKNMRAAQALFQQKHPKWHHTFGKVSYDLSRALDGLLKLDYIDPARIGTIGHSLGAWDSVYFWANEPRVKAAAVNSSGAHWLIPQVWFDQKWRLKFAAGELPLKPNTDMSAQIFLQMGAPKPLLYMRAIKDIGTDYLSTPQEHIRMIREYYQTFGKNPYQIRGKNQFAVFFHDEGHDFPPFARALAYSWLEAQLNHGGSK